jgi:hypothetical protein
MSTQPPREHRPPVPPSFRERLGAGLRRPAIWLPLQTAGVAAAAALLVFVVVGRTTGVPAGQAREVRRLRAANEALRRQNELLQPKLAAVPQLESKVSELEREAARIRRENERLRQSAEPAGPPAPRPTVDAPRAPAGPGRAPLPEAARTALARGQLPLPAAVQALIGTEGTLAGGPSGGTPLALTGPVGTAVVDDRPSFRWQPLAGASRYRVTVADASGSELTSGETTGATQWTPIQALPRGKTLQWEVQAFQGDRELDKSPKPPAPEARFLILPAAAADDLAATRRRAARQLTYADYQLTMAALYAQAGLLDDAQSALQELLQATPKSADTRRLLQDLQRRRTPKR